MRVEKWCDTETIPKNEKHEMEVEISRLIRKLGLQLRLLTERNKLHTTKKEEQIAHNKESRTTSSRRRTRRNTSRKVEAEFQKICDDIFAVMDKNLISSARRIARTEGHQQRTLKRSSRLSKSILNRSLRSDRQHRKPRATRILRSRVVYPRTYSTT